MVASIDFSRARCIVELGGGTGCITRALLKRMRPDARLIAFELNPTFAQMLESIGDPRLRVVTDSAERIRHYLDEAGFGGADYIISGLPLAVLPKPVTATILDEARSALQVDGAYIQFQYSLVSRRPLSERFSRIRIGFTPWNVPPAFVYVCRA